MNKVKYCFNKYQNEIILGLCIIFSIVMLIPVFRVGFHNYASGDDYWYGAYTYQGLKNGGLAGGFLGSLKMIKEVYETWQGTWFTMFLFTLAPQNFNPHLYVITVFISIAALLWAEGIIIRRYVLEEYGFSKSTFYFILFMVFNISVQYIPRTTSGIFWFNGIMHYTIPFFIAMGCISLTRFLKSQLSGKKKIFIYVGIILGMTALGGSNYLAAIIGLFGIGYEVIICLIDDWTKEKKIYIKKYIVLIIAVVLEFIGLFISYKSPGNDIRSGDDMSFRPMYFLRCIWWSIDRGRILGIQLIKERPIVILYMLVVAIVIFLEISKRYKDGEYKKLVAHPVIAFIFVNGIHLATYLPEVYSNSDVSGGVPNTHFQTLLLLLLFDFIIIEDVIVVFISHSKKIVKLHNTSDYVKNIYIFATSIIILLVISFGPVKTTNDYCLDYINSGRMKEYETVWWKQYNIYTNSDIMDAVIPEYYDDVYPVCHMPLIEDAEFEHNYHRARYYGKNSVSAIDWKEGN